MPVAATRFLRSGSSTTASPRNDRISPTSHSSPAVVSRTAEPSESGVAPRSTSQRATSGEYQIRTGRVPSNSFGSKPSRGSKRSRCFLALRIRSSRKLRSASRSRSHVWTYQYGSRRSRRYGSTVRVVESLSPSLRCSISTSFRLLIASLKVDTRSTSARGTSGSGVWASSNAPNVSSSFLRTRSSGVWASAAIIGPTNSSASRIARASSGVSLGGARNVSPNSSLSTWTWSPRSSAYTA